MSSYNYVITYVITYNYVKLCTTQIIHTKDIENKDGIILDSIQINI